MIQEMISENFPVSPPESIQHQAPSVDTAIGSVGGHLCSEHCALFHSTTFFQPMADVNVVPDSVMSGALDGTYDYEDSIMFPALFGSAEF